MGYRYFHWNKTVNIPQTLYILTRYIAAFPILSFIEKLITADGTDTDKSFLTRAVLMDLPKVFGYIRHDLPVVKQDTYDFISE